MALKGSLRIDDGLDLTIRRSLAGSKASYNNGGRIRGRGPDPHQLAKLFPAEAATLYPLAIAAAQDDFPLRLGLIMLIVAALVWYRYHATQPKGGGRPDWWAIFISAVSFFLYVASLGGFGVLLENQERTSLLLSFLSILWLWVVSTLPAKSLSGKTTAKL